MLRYCIQCTNRYQWDLVGSAFKVTNSVCDACVSSFAICYCILYNTCKMDGSLYWRFCTSAYNLGDVTCLRWVVIMSRPFLPYGISSTRFSSCVYGVTCSNEFILCFHKHKMKILFNEIQNWPKFCFTIALSDKGKTATPFYSFLKGFPPCWVVHLA